MKGDGSYRCESCGHVFRRDAKGIHRYMALGMQEALEVTERTGRDCIHTTQLNEGRRGHDFSLLRHWGLIAPVERPAWAGEHGYRGSRGFSGFYQLTPLGIQFTRGEVKVPARIIREPGDEHYEVDYSKMIDIFEALNTDAQADL